MGLGVGGGNGTSEVTSHKTKGEKLTRALVIEDINIIEVDKIIEVPKIKYVESEQLKYITKEEFQTKFLTKEEPTIKYVPIESETTRYTAKEELTIRYVPNDVPCEKPVIVEKVYEKPIIKEIEHIVVKIADLNIVKETMVLLPKLILELDSLRESIYEIKKSLDQIRNYKLIEQEVKVPKILYIPTEIERIVYKDIIKERS